MMQLTIATLLAMIMITLFSINDQLQEDAEARKSPEQRAAEAQLERDKEAFELKLEQERTERSEKAMAALDELTWSEAYDQNRLAEKAILPVLNSPFFLYFILIIIPPIALHTVVRLRRGY